MNNLGIYLARTWVGGLGVIKGISYIPSQLLEDTLMTTFVCVTVSVSLDFLRDTADSGQRSRAQVEGRGMAIRWM